MHNPHSSSLHLSKLYYHSSPPSCHLTSLVSRHPFPVFSFVCRIQNGLPWLFSWLSHSHLSSQHQNATFSEKHFLAALSKLDFSVTFYFSVILLFFSFITLISNCTYFVIVFLHLFIVFTLPLSLECKFCQENIST